MIKRRKKNMDKYKRAVDILKSGLTGEANLEAIADIEELIEQVELLEPQMEKTKEHMENIADKVVIMRQELEHYKNRYEYYKHEWCAEQDAREELERNQQTLLDTIDVLIARYKALEAQTTKDWLKDKLK